MIGRSEGRTLDAYVPVRLSTAQRDRLRRLAGERETSVSALIREAADKMLDRSGQGAA